MSHRDTEAWARGIALAREVRLSAVATLEARLVELEASSTWNTPELGFVRAQLVKLRTEDPMQEVICTACGASIIFVPTLASGGVKRIPLDAEPNEEGNVELVHEGGETRAKVLGPKAQAQENLLAVARWMPHHATCPRWAKKGDDDARATGPGEVPQEGRPSDQEATSGPTRAGPNRSRGGTAEAPDPAVADGGVPDPGQREEGLAAVRQILNDKKPDQGDRP